MKKWSTLACAAGAALYVQYNTPFPLLRPLVPERAHQLAVSALKLPKLGRRALGLVRTSRRLETTVFGIHFPSAIGIGAGFDKDAEAVEGLLDLGFGFVEVGSVTPLFQEGNQKPRLWRLARQKSIVNSYGFNSLGALVVAENLRKFRERSGGIVGVNLGKNKETQDAGRDYEVGAKVLGKYADYLVVNVSSPNTPNLRQLQQETELTELIRRVHRRAVKTPILVKIAPDLTAEQAEEIARVALRENIDGIIISNTTVERPNGIGAGLPGGLSGAPLKDLSTRLLAQISRLTQKRIPLIGVGGVFTGADAYEKIRAGASLVQIYSSFALEGPKVLAKIEEELAALLERDGFRCVSEAVGKDVEKIDS